MGFSARPFLLVHCSSACRREACQPKEPAPARHLQGVVLLLHRRPVVHCAVWPRATGRQAGRRASAGPADETSTSADAATRRCPSPSPHGLCRGYSIAHAVTHTSGSLSMAAPPEKRRGSDEHESVDPAAKRQRRVEFHFREATQHAGSYQASGSPFAVPVAHAGGINLRHRALPCILRFFFSCAWNLLV